MMDFINEHFLLLMIGVAFILFALIGFIVDKTKNKNAKLESLSSGDEDSLVESPVIEAAEEAVEESTELPEPQESEDEFVLTDKTEVTEENLIPEVEDNN